MIPLDAIHENGHNVRRVAASNQADQALLDSVRAQGVLVPILVRPEGDGYTVIAGHRRVRAARAAGLTEIPALVINGLVNGHATAAQAAENMVRAPMHPVDQWRAVVQLQAEGFTLQAATASLGLGAAVARRFDRLGRLHPDLLALIEATDDMPDDDALRIIAMAPEITQRDAARHKAAVRREAGRIVEVAWWRIANMCDRKRISRKLAIFDPDDPRIAWDEDLFARPGSDDQFTTAQTDRFLELQREALAADIKARQAKKGRVALAELNAHGGVKVPAGWRELFGEAGRRKPKTTECLFYAVRETGLIAAVLAVDTKAEREREKAKQRAAADKAKKAKPQAGAEEIADADADAQPDAAPAAEDDESLPAAEARSPISKEGHKLIAAAKTATLRTCLRESIAELPLETLVALLVLALGCRNVEVRSDEVRFTNRHFEDLAARLLLPGGHLGPVTGADARAIAGEALARIMSVRPEGGLYASGDPAEWIGMAIGADDALPRFDTAEFLAHVSGAELRRVAAAAEISVPAKVGAMREALVGKLPNWRPTAFGAPAPLVEKSDDD